MPLVFVFTIFVFEQIYFCLSGESYDESNALGDPLGPSGATDDVSRVPQPAPSGPGAATPVDPIPSQTPVPTGNI